MRIASIVEGKGDAEAFPVLLRRILHDVCPREHHDVLRPIRIPRSRLVRPGELERAADLASRMTGPGDAVVVLIDADDDRPQCLAPELLHRLTRRDRVYRVILANREFEAWFLAAAKSLQGRRGLRDDITAPSNPEDIRDAKGWLREHSVSGSSYRPTADQAALSGVLDLDLAMRAPSFAKLVRDIRSVTEGTAT
ncbi:MAG: hypothetical protein DRQ55_14460 [Planctomycetota bacterium]|nr:MAG: hypothetical protein DRQ55_14460 [Planctomycetota bacterium]